MRELTQTSLYPNGNCWQTCVACILDLDPDALPPQAKYDHSWVDAEGKKNRGPNYNNVLGRYLRKHHGLLYAEPHPSTLLEQVIPVGYHMLTGRTVRSDAYDGMRHVVVGYRGRMVWDPHPSRAGLLEEIRLGLLVPFPPEYRKYWDQTDASEPCVCPACSPSAKKCGCPECSPPAA